MHISDDLPQFHNGPALIVVTGRETATLYRAENAEIMQMEELAVEMPEPTERPGHFEEGAHGKTYTSGTAFDPKRVKREAQRRLAAALPEFIQSHTTDTAYKYVYIFTPEYMHKDVEAALPAALADVLEHVFSGNYTKHHPFDLLRAIADLEPSVEERVPPHKREVKKILSRFWKRK